MVTLFRKRGKMEIDLPAGWRILSTIFKESVNAESSLQGLVRQGLDRPVDGRPLESFVKAGARVAIVVDDLTRPTPVADILPVVLERLHGCGVNDADIAIVMGVGTHRPMTDAEIRDRCGANIAATYHCQNHDCRAADLAAVGATAESGPVFINRTVASADVRIAIGSILPHPHNGFGGGPKNVMPGICDFDTIRRHHLKNVVNPRSILGNLQENPFYEECCRIAALARMDFSVSCIYDSLGQVCDIVTGDIFAVHRAGTEKTRSSLGVPVLRTADVTLVSAYPYDEGPQIVKPVLPAAMVTNPGGAIFLLADGAAPLPDFFLDSFSALRACGDDGGEAFIRQRLECIQPIIEGPMDFNMAIILVFFAASKYRICLVADRLMEDAARRMGFEYAEDLPAALAEEARKRGSATVNVIPAGGYVYPVLSQPFRLIDAGAGIS